MVPTEVLYVGILPRGEWYFGGMVINVALRMDKITKATIDPFGNFLSS